MYFEKKAIVFATCFLDIFVNHAIFGTQILFLGTMGFHSLSTACLFFPVILKSLLLALTLAYYSPLILLPMEALLIFFPGASIFICSWCEDVPGWWKSAKSPFLLPFLGLSMFSGNVTLSVFFISHAVWWLSAYWLHIHLQSFQPPTRGSV